MEEVDFFRLELEKMDWGEHMQDGEEWGAESEGW